MLLSSRFGWRHRRRCWSSITSYKASKCGRWNRIPANLPPLQLHGGEGRSLSGRVLLFLLHNFIEFVGMYLVNHTELGIMLSGKVFRLTKPPLALLSGASTIRIATLFSILQSKGLHRKFWFTTQKYYLVFNSKCLVQIAPDLVNL